MSVIADPSGRMRHNPSSGRGARSTRHGASAAAVGGGLPDAAVWQPGGWLVVATDGGPAAGEPLVRHADWLGPAKLTSVGGKLERLTEVYVSPEMFGGDSMDHESKEQRDELFAELAATVFADRSPGEPASWCPPRSGRLVAWLAEGGYRAVVDNEDDLRLTLKARGCDGQVRVRREAQRLRLTLRLGSWSDLTTEAETAMLGLARQANDRGRLARIAWMIDGQARHCDAQVDLTGLPADGLAARIWPDMLCLSVRGLELALRRLGMELDALADPGNLGLVARLNSSAEFQSVGTVPAGDS